MTRDELTAWAARNGWRMVAGCPSLVKPGLVKPGLVKPGLVKPGGPKDAIVRLSFKATVVSLEVRKATKWEKVGSATYADVVLDDDGDRLLNLGFEKVPSIGMLMRDNRDAQAFSGPGV